MMAAKIVYLLVFLALHSGAFGQEVKKPEVSLLRVIHVLCTNGMTVIADLPVDGWNTTLNKVDTGLSKEDLKSLDVVAVEKLLEERTGLEFKIDREQKTLWIGEGWLSSVLVVPRRKGEMGFHAMMAGATSIHGKILMPPFVQFQDPRLCEAKVSVKAGEPIWSNLPQILNSIGANFFFMSPVPKPTRALPEGAVVVDTLDFGLLSIDKDTFSWGK